MTIDQWLMIALIISTLSAPTIAEWAKPRINQPKPAANVNQDETRVKRIFGVFAGWVMWPWGTPSLIMALALRGLYQAFHTYSPITTSTVFMISFFVGSMFFALVANMFLSAKRRK
jgi:hypothetical protein